MAKPPAACWRCGGIFALLRPLRDVFNPQRALGFNMGALIDSGSCVYMLNEMQILGSLRNSIIKASMLGG